MSIWIRSTIANKKLKIISVRPYFGKHPPTFALRLGYVNLFLLLPIT
jgi:hypothetical protein